MTEELSRNLTVARAKANKTLQELAKDSGISITTISLIESGKKKNVRLTTIVKLAEALKIDYHYLIG